LKNREHSGAPKQLGNFNTFQCELKTSHHPQIKEDSFLLTLGELALTRSSKHQSLNLIEP
jgi:hypothetical protein